jgi:RNA polymerase sigma-70 factor (ECF subfamily)
MDFALDNRSCFWDKFIMVLAEAVKRLPVKLHIADAIRRLSVKLHMALADGRLPLKLHMALTDRRLSAKLHIALDDSSFDKDEDMVGQLSAAERAGRLIDLYGNSILRLAYSYLHNMSDAEDILQDTLIQYIRSAPLFESPDNEKRWLLKVASNISKNRIKYNSYRETDELMEELVAEDKEDLSFVWEAVRALPEKYREVIHLFYEEGLSTKEIADTLGRKEATIRSDLLRGREKLKTVLKEEYDFE